MNSIEYQKYCLQRGIGSSVVFGSFFTGISVAQGHPLTPSLAATNIGGLYLYVSLICPMEAIHGRQSALHNALSGSILGYIGVQSQRLGIPCVDPHFFYRYPQLSPPLVGAAVYGAVGMLLVTASGKPI